MHLNEASRQSIARVHLVTDSVNQPHPPPAAHDPSGMPLPRTATTPPPFNRCHKLHAYDFSEAFRRRGMTAINIPTSNKRMENYLLVRILCLATWPQQAGNMCRSCLPCLVS